MWNCPGMAGLTGDRHRRFPAGQVRAPSWLSSSEKNPFDGAGKGFVDDARIQPRLGDDHPAARQVGGSSPHAGARSRNRDNTVSRIFNFFPPDNGLVSRMGGLRKGRGHFVICATIHTCRRGSSAVDSSLVRHSPDLLQCGGGYSAGSYCMIKFAGFGQVGSLPP